MTGIRLENQDNSNWGKIFLDYKEKEYQFPYYLPTNEVFNHDPDILIRLKCTALVGLTPLVSILRSIYWLATSIFMAISEAYRYLDGQPSSEEAKIAIYENAYDSLRALGYGALMTGNALMGILAPYRARLQYSCLERELNHHSDGPHRNKFYLAICFQRLYVLDKDNENDNQAAEKLTSYLSRIDTIRTAFKSCSFRQLLVELRIMRPIRA